MPTSILIADDHQMLREGLKSLLSQEDGLEVIAETGDGRELLHLCRETQPDIILLDISMPGLNGMLALKAIREISSGSKVVMLTMHFNETYVQDSLRGGASAYVLKECAVDDLVRAIHAVSNGEVYLSGPIVTSMVGSLIGEKKPAKSPDGLSAREKEILQLIGEGNTSKEMAEALCLSVRTVENHRAHLMRKLGVRDIPSMVKCAIRLGLVQLNS